MAYKDPQDPRNKAAKLKHYYKNKEKYIKKSLERRKQLRSVKLIYILTYLQLHPCVDCEEKDPIVLEFDHVRGKKIANISKFITSDNKMYSLEEMKKEIFKCDIRCANCHKRKTAKQFSYDRLTILEILMQGRSDSN